MNVGFANGVFDLFHDGHRHFLTACRRHCSYLIVAVNVDPWCKRKGLDRPFDNLEKRMLHVRGYAEAVIPFWGDPVPLIEEIGCDVVLRGYDQAEDAPAWAKVVRIGHLEGFSTTLAASHLKNPTP